MNIIDNINKNTGLDFEVEEAKNLDKLSKIFHDSALSAGYYVLQKVNRRVFKKGDEFVYDPPPQVSHREPNPVADHIRRIVDHTTLSLVGERVNKLALFHSDEIGALFRAGLYTGKNIPQKVGNVIGIVNKSPEDAFLNFSVFGGFSTELDSSFVSGRVTLDNAFAFQFPNNPSGNETINVMISSLNANARRHDNGTKNNFLFFKSALLGTFPKNTPVTNAVKSNMLREIEVQEIIDFR